VPQYLCQILPLGLPPVHMTANWLAGHRKIALTDHLQHLPQNAAPAGIHVLHPVSIFPLRLGQTEAVLGDSVSVL